MSIIHDMEVLRNELAVLARETQNSDMADHFSDLRRDAQSILERLYSADRQLASMQQTVSGEDY